MDSNNYPGLYRGLVFANNDPEKRGRIRVKIPALLADQVTGWVMPCVDFGHPFTESNHALLDLDDAYPTAVTTFRGHTIAAETHHHQTRFVVPPVNKPVWIMFEGGNINHPVWMGTWEYAIPGNEGLDSLGISELDKITLGAPAMGVIGGSPTLSAVNIWDLGWLLDSATREWVGGHFSLPPSWLTADIWVWWTNVGAGSGNVVMRSIRNTFVDGFAVGVTGDSLVTVAAPAQNVYKRTRLATGISVTNLRGVSVERDATQGTDTLNTNDIAIIAIEIVRVT